MLCWHTPPGRPGVSRPDATAGVGSSCLAAVAGGRCAATDAAIVVSGSGRVPACRLMGAVAGGVAGGAGGKGSARSALPFRCLTKGLAEEQHIRVVGHDLAPRLYFGHPSGALLCLLLWLVLCGVKMLTSITLLGVACMRADASAAEEGSAADFLYGIIGIGDNPVAR